MTAEIHYLTLGKPAPEPIISPFSELARRRDQMVREFTAWLKTMPDEAQVSAQLRMTVDSLNEIAVQHFAHGGP